jgi:outer membrane protein W
MKTKMLLLAAMILFGIEATYAQVKDQISIGPRVGVNFSNVSNVDNSESVTGLLLGLTSTYSISERSGITLDILYSSEGYKLGSDELKIHNLQIPIYFDVFFGELGSAFRPKVYVGVVTGFFLDAKFNDNESSKDLYNGFLFGASGGLGFNYRMASRIWLNTDLRANIGLIDIRDQVLDGDDLLADRTFSLSVGLAYGLSKL